MTMLPSRAVEMQKEGQSVTAIAEALGVSSQHTEGHMALHIAVGALALAVIALAVSVGRLWRYIDVLWRYIDVLSEIAVKQALVDAMRQARAKEREA